MKFLLTLYGDESAWENATPEDGAKEMAEYEKVGREMETAGVMRGGEGLQATTTAQTLSLRSGERVVTDGPFAETKEQLGGYYLLECKDIDEALTWAEKIPAARNGSVEVRPVMTYE